MPMKDSTSAYTQAVIKTGGKQYLVKPGTSLKVEKIAVEAGTLVEVPAVLVMEEDGKLKSGTDHMISVKVTGDTKGDKIRVFKFKAKKRYRRTQGHRQQLSVIEVGNLVK